MAPPSLYDMSVPVYIRALESMLGVLQKGEQWANDNGVPLSKLFEARLAPDMHPLPYQVQRASDTSKAILTRVAGVKEVPAMPDNETSFPELYERIQKTVDVLKTAKPEDFVGKEDSEVSMFDGKFKFSGLSYMQNFGLPNFFFHVTTAYAILRKEGVPVGKMDYLGVNRAQ